MLNIVKLLYLWLTFMHNVYLYYDPISSGYIGILPEGPLIILVEVFEALKLAYFKVVLPQLVSEQASILRMVQQILERFWIKDVLNKSVTKMRRTR